MVRRITIITLLCCGLLAALFPSTKESQSWTGEYSIVAAPISQPTRNAEAEQRERPLQPATMAQAQRQNRVIRIVIAPRPRYIVTLNGREASTQQPLAPKSTLLPSRAPPVSC